MSFLFGTKKKDPAALARGCKEALLIVEKSGPKANEKAVEELSKIVAQMKLTLYGDPESSESNAEVSQQLVNEILAIDLIPLVITNFAKFEFEAKKDIILIFNNMLRRTTGNRAPFVEYICSHAELLNTLVLGYESADIALQCGAMLRECIRHEALAKIILYSRTFFNFFNYVELATFDVASDAFGTFKELLTKHKALSAEFLEKNYDKVFELYTQLLKSQNYVTRRQSLKLLGELLLDRANFNIMTKYISDSANLQLMMILLKDKSKSIQFEAFHVFKVFVANPNKTPPISKILTKNKEKLLTFLGNFHNDNEEEQFNDEKQFLIKQIQAL